MLLSKIFNNRHLLDIENAIINPDGSSKPSYFCLGLPPLNPPRIRGSMLITLNWDFLERNKAHLSKASLCDSGGLQRQMFAAGFENEPVRTPGPNEFFGFVEKFEKLPSKCKRDWLKFRKSREVDDLLCTFLDPVFVDALAGSTDPHAMLPEVEFERFKVEISDIVGIWAPNTYKFQSNISKILSRYNQIEFYNPALGIESVLRNLDVLDRYI